MHTPEGVERWTYATLWDRSVEVAKALIACGAGKDSRVGIMMTNRLEWIAGVFGTALAGGVAVTISTFSTAPELDYMLQASGVSVLLFEGSVLKKTFVEMLCDLEPAIRRARPGQLESTRFPFLRHLVAVGSDARRRHRALVRLSRARKVDPGHPGRGEGRLGPTQRHGRPLLLLRFHEQAQGHSQRASGRCDSALEICAHPRPRGGCPLLDCERLLLVGQFRHGDRRHLPFGWGDRAPADLPGGRGAGADAGGEGELPGCLAPSVAAAGRGAQLEHGGSQQRALCRSDDPAGPTSDGVDELARAELGVWQYGDLHHQHGLPRRHAGGGDRGQSWRGAARQHGEDRRSR